jgi:hypothetical protein
MKHKLMNQSRNMNAINHQSNSINADQDQVLKTEELNEIVGAIVDGKYSWACVLILSSIGYNPLHYLPYRTYHRLVKENDQCEKIS